MDLRELKKHRTREGISNAAIELFLAHGFDQVSITQIAEAAEVSRRTLFAYFRSKEDLVLYRIADHETESARVVRERKPDDPPLASLYVHYLDGLRNRDPITGLSAVPEQLAFYRLIMQTPALMARMLKFNENAEQALAEALHETAGLPELTARLAAAQIVSVQWTLSLANHRQVFAGVDVDRLYPEAVEAAEQGFSLLANGLGSAGLR